MRWAAGDDCRGRGGRRRSLSTRDRRASGAPGYGSPGRESVMMWLSHSTWGMPRVPIADAVAHCAALGFDGLELTVIPGWVTDAAGLDRSERRRIRALYDEHRLELCGLSGNTPLLDTGSTDHAANMARLRGYLDLAAELQHPGERLTVSTT